MHKMLKPSTSPIRCLGGIQGCPEDDLYNWIARTCSGRYTAGKTLEMWKEKASLNNDMSPPLYNFLLKVSQGLYDQNQQSGSSSTIIRPDEVQLKNLFVKEGCPRTLLKDFLKLYKGVGHRMIKEVLGNPDYPMMSEELAEYFLKVGTSQTPQEPQRSSVIPEVEIDKLCLLVSIYRNAKLSNKDYHKVLNFIEYLSQSSG